jgi:MFS family permease
MPRREEKLLGRDWALALTAAAVMLATLPGRTQGLSLITEPLIEDLKLDRVTFANINLWATLVGAMFCVPAGWLFDRFGLRWPTALIIGALGAVTAGLSFTPASVPLLFLLLTATRGLGQSALSVASITAVGKRFGDRAGMPMAIFSIALSLFFAIAFGLIGYAVRMAGWRNAWLGVAVAPLVLIVPFVILYLRVESSTLPDEPAANIESGLTLAEALRTRAFWTFAGAAALFNLVSSGFGLFNEAILAEHGFDRRTFHIFLGVTTLVSLGGQFLAGWLSRRMPYRALTSVAMGIYAVGLILVPFVSSFVELLAVSILIGVAAGMIMVVFFSVWAEAFGRAQLGRVQGAAQLLTVIASAAGPSLFAAWHARNGSYTPLLVGIALVVALVSVLALKTPSPLAQEEPAAN